MTTRQDIASGARSVEAEDHGRSGTTQPQDPAVQHREPANALGANPAEMHLGEVTLSMFEQGQSVTVRVGGAFNSAELYEAKFDSAEDANFALLEAGILQEQQVPNRLEVVGKGIKLAGVTSEQLQHAGLRQHQSPKL